MSGFVPDRHVTIFIATIMAVDVWYPGQWSEDTARGEPPSFTIDGPDGSPLQVFEPTALESASYQLRQRLASGALKGYVLEDSGALTEITRQHWLSRQADIQFECRDWEASHQVRTDQGLVSGRVLLNVDEVRAMLALEGITRSAVDKAAPPRTESGRAQAPRRKRASPKSGLAAKVLHELYGDKIPPQTEVANAELIIAVHEKLPQGTNLERDSILRAAGRRK